MADPAGPPGPSGALPPLGAHNTQLTEAQQEALLRAKYGGLLPKKKLAPRGDHKFFDSADWALSKQAPVGGAAPGGPTGSEGLQPKLEPTQHQLRGGSQLRRD